MPRPSKRKLASRDNLLKARAKMNQLRSLYMSSGGSEVSKIVESLKTQRDVHLDGLMTENDDQVEDVLQKGPLVNVAAPSPDSGLGEHPEEIVSGSKLSDENGAIPENKAHIKEKGLNFNQSVHGKMAHKGLLVVDHCLKDSKRGMKMATDSTPGNNARQIMVAREKAEATQPVEQRAKSYLRIYKENYRTSKKMKLLRQISISDGDP
ncbi:unnamed protein product [Rhizoctonia solani]|uniref:Uncharacterized protein n=1 Tax=Rhizoctonia solani TaxID=456999 RepID=A0A8H3HBX3_9AGAM|nr:unnamed protein product [Rhizoctonia solani]